MAPDKETEPIEARRAAVVQRLIEPGARRRQLVAELERIDAEIRPLVLEAAEVGVPHRRIGELVGLSGAGVHRWVVKGRTA